MNVLSEPWRFTIDNVSGTWYVVLYGIQSVEFNIYINRGTSMPITDDVMEYINDKAEGNVFPEEQT